MLKSGVKEVSKYKHQWLQNVGKLLDDESCRAQAKAISNTKSNEIAIHSLMPNGDRECRLYSNIEPEAFVSKLLTHNYGLYEILIEHRKRKIYFDIDHDKDDIKLNKAKKIISDTFPEAIMNISGNKEHGSYHIVLQNYYYENLEEMECLKLWILEQNKDGEIFDKAIYTKNRLMKCVNQSKPRKYLQTILEGSSDARDHLITCFFKSDCKNAKDIIKISEKIVQKSREDKNYVVINSIPQLHKSLPDDEFDVFEASPIKLLEILPNPKKGELGCLHHDIIFKICSWAKCHKVTFEQFWSWCLLKENSQSRLQKWKKVYDSIDPKFFISNHFIYRVLERTYPDILKDKSKKQFQNSHVVTYTKLIKGQYFAFSDFTDKKVQILGLGLGANKTGGMIDYIKKKSEDPNFSSIVFTPRIALASNLKGRYNSNEVKCVLYKDLKKKQKSEVGNHPGNYIWQCESLHYLKDRSEPFDCVVVDEIETVLNSWISETHKSNLEKNWKVFLECFKRAKKIILIDALLSQKTFRFLRNLGIDDGIIEVIGREKEPKPRYITFFRDHKQDGIHKKYRTFIRWRSLLVKKLNEGKKCYVFYPYSKGPSNKLFPSMEEFKEQIVHDCTVPINALWYHGQSDGKQKRDLEIVNEVWTKLNLVICNGAITVGVNYDLPDFDECFIAYASFGLPRDVVQTSMRIRTLTSNHVYLCHINNFVPKAISHPTTSDPVFNNLIRDVVKENNCKNIDCVKYLFTKANYKIKPYKSELYDVSADTIEEYEKLKKETDELCVYNWDLIRDIDHVEAEDINNKVWIMTSSFDENLQLLKYNYTYLFKEDVPQEILKARWNRCNFFFKYYEYKNSDNWIKKMLKELKLQDIILPSKFSLSEELTNEIRECIAFNRLSNDCNSMILVSRALNEYFHMNSYEWRATDNKNGKYNMNPDFIELQETALACLNLETESYAPKTCLFNI